MDCEDCKNYEPKGESKQLALVRRTCENFCKGKCCDACELPIPDSTVDCPIYKVMMGHWK